MIWFKAFAGAMVSFLIIDAIWIGLVVRKIYQREVPELLTESPNLVAAAMFYVAYVAGIVFLAVQPAIAAGSAKIALINGAVLGAVAYGTFTFTNFAVLKGWTSHLVWTDIAWGTFLTGFCALIGYLATRV